MGRQKTRRFEETFKARNVIEETKPHYHQMKGKWNKDFFGNDQPITLEIGCGKGEYSVGLAKIYPERNFIGVDIKGDRLWAGSRRATEGNLSNVCFLRAQVQHIEDFFEPNEVSCIWITFPDPRPRDRDIKRRLTNPRFLEYYKTLLKPGGMVYFKTDNTPLFEYTLEVLRERSDILDLEHTFNLYESEYMDEHHGIKTKFEQKFHDLGEDIKYLKFRFDQ
ncbi:MAG: tRNA (guanosine(46)-N7)-methyltransferase TrmB [Roseivirga sp.]